jgi:hypothetical protein
MAAARQNQRAQWNAQPDRPAELGRRFIAIPGSLGAHPACDRTQALDHGTRNAVEATEYRQAFPRPAIHKVKVGLANASLILRFRMTRFRRGLHHDDNLILYSRQRAAQNAGEPPRDADQCTFCPS